MGVGSDAGPGKHGRAVQAGAGDQDAGLFQPVTERS